MSRISRHTYCDGFYTLSTKIGDKVFTITYSDNTKYEEAYKDFAQQIKKEVETCRVQ